ncbi:hypothetical protein E3N88_28977 [Mikania micrantha]|uniref:Uncharacterized protein n=1 Tax=Mikania micrantha TaxID=192012 RepID=A0A5N6N216_9ASTR|nr:hypothetical protein E3N88_28977 [Mikania micrantha]
MVSAQTLPTDQFATMGADLGLSLIQVIRDMDANPHSPVREVELIGTSETIAKTEQQIKEVLAKFVPAKSATMDEKLDDHASLISRVEVLEYQCDELRNDIEQMCMKMLNLITVINFNALTPTPTPMCLLRENADLQEELFRVLLYQSSSWGSNECSNEFYECLHFFTYEHEDEPLEVVLLILSWLDLHFEIMNIAFLCLAGNFEKSKGHFEESKGHFEESKDDVVDGKIHQEESKMETRGIVLKRYLTLGFHFSNFTEENNGGHAATALMACIAPKAKQQTQQHNEHTITAATVGCAQRIVDATKKAGRNNAYLELKQVPPVNIESNPDPRVNLEVNMVPPENLETNIVPPAAASGSESNEGVIARIVREQLSACGVLTQHQPHEGLSNEARPESTWSNEDVAV